MALSKQIPVLQLSQAVCREYDEKRIIDNMERHMSDSDFNQLAGQIHGLAEAYRVLARMLQQQGAIDRQLLQANLRIHADDFPPLRDAPVARQMLQMLADTLLGDYLKDRGCTPSQIAEALEDQGVEEDG